MSADSSTKQVLESIAANPGQTADAIADRLALQARVVRAILKDLVRRELITGEKTDIRFREGVTPESASRSIEAEFEPGLPQPSLVQELARRIQALRQSLERFQNEIASTVIGTPLSDLRARYEDRLTTWLSKVNPEAAEYPTLEADLKFVKPSGGLTGLLPSPGPVTGEPADFRVVSVASFNDLKSLRLKGTVLPLSVSLSISQKAAFLQRRGSEPAEYFEPETPAAFQPEHLRDLDEYPPELDYSDKIRVRYSENKVYLYEFCERLMREHTPSALFLGESVLPPDMWARDMEKPFRKTRHLHCMHKAVELANASKIFNSPIAQSTRTNSSRRRETSILTRIVFGLLATDPAHYIQLTSRGNFDDVIFSRISVDKEVSPVFTLSERHQYLPDSAAESKAMQIFGDDDRGKTFYTAYQNMLRQLQTSIFFLNYKGRGLRFRFFSFPVSNDEITEWARRLASTGYTLAVAATDLESIAYVSGVEQATNAAARQAKEIFAAALRTLETNAQAGR